MDILIVALSALFASGLTLYSGFGLGTLLLPVYALFFPVETAVAATALVHGANNLLKVGVVGRYADRDLVLRFGLPAIAAAFLGAVALGYVASFPQQYTYSIGPRLAVVTPIKLAMGMLILGFALLELLPHFRHLRFDRKYLMLGGFLSGFFGGFSGHQGALRSAFLTKVGISPQAFVGTNALIGCLVDMARIAVYGGLVVTADMGEGLHQNQWALIVTGCLAALAGVLLGKRFLYKVTMRTVQTITGYMLLAVAFALSFGFI